MKKIIIGLLFSATANAAQISVDQILAVDLDVRTVCPSVSSVDSTGAIIFQTQTDAGLVQQQCALAVMAKYSTTPHVNIIGKICPATGAC